MSPIFDMDKIPDTEENDFQPIPEGKYECVCSECVEKESKAGNKYFSLTWIVDNGMYKGRMIWDMIFWHNPAVLERLKLVCKRLGLPYEGSVEIFPKDFEGRRAILTVIIETQLGFNPKNKVTFAGYERVEAEGGVGVSMPSPGHRQESDGVTRAIDNDDDVPF